MSQTYTVTSIPIWKLPEKNSEASSEKQLRMTVADVAGGHLELVYTPPTPQQGNVYTSIKTLVSIKRHAVTAKLDLLCINYRY